jgi:hypothetical protein
LVKEILKDPEVASVVAVVEVADLAKEILDQRRCIALHALNAVPDAKYPSNQAETNQSTAITASKGKKDLIQEDPEEEIPADSDMAEEMIQKDQACMKQHATHAESLVKFLLNRLRENLFIATIVSVAKAIGQILNQIQESQRYQRKNLIS